MARTSDMKHYRWFFGMAFIVYGTETSAAQTIFALAICFQYIFLAWRLYLERDDILGMDIMMVTASDGCMVAYKSYSGTASERSRSCITRGASEVH